MFVINLGEREATDLIARVAAHLPIGASLGQILAVTRSGVLTGEPGAPGELYGYVASGNYTFRMADVGGGTQELTRWTNGVEIARRILRARADDGSEPN